MHSSHFPLGMEQAGSSRNARWDIETPAGICHYLLSPFFPTPYMKPRRVPSTSIPVGYTLECDTVPLVKKFPTFQDRVVFLFVGPFPKTQLHMPTGPKVLLHR